MNETIKQDIIDRFNTIIAALDVAAWQIATITEDDVEKDIVSSTCWGKTCIIEKRKTRDLLKKLEAK